MDEPVRAAGVMQRRAFLRAAVLAIGGSAFAACARRSRATRLDVFLGGADVVAGMRNYLSFAFRGAPRAPHQMVRVTLRNDAGEMLGPFVAERFEYARVPEGVPRDVHALNVDVPTTGTWQVRVDLVARGAVTAAGEAFFRARARTDAGPPVAGERAVAVATPTVADDRGVVPICTRVPRCPFHEVSLDEALRAGDAVAFFVGSPKFCRSRTCGPNLEELITVARGAGTRARFIHAEVHPNEHADTIRRFVTTRAFKAWRLQTEPWLFLIDGNGRVAARFEGPVTAAQLQQQVGSLR